MAQRATSRGDLVLDIKKRQDPVDIMASDGRVGLFAAGSDPVGCGLTVCLAGDKMKVGGPTPPDRDDQRWAASGLHTLPVTGRVVRCTPMGACDVDDPRFQFRVGDAIRWEHRDRDNGRAEGEQGVGLPHFCSSGWW
jgi:hypothetical protein